MLSDWQNVTRTFFLLFAGFTTTSAEDVWVRPQSANGRAATRGLLESPLGLLRKADVSRSKATAGAARRSAGNPAELSAIPGMIESKSATGPRRATMSSLTMPRPTNRVRSTAPKSGTAIEMHLDSPSVASPARAQFSDEMPWPDVVVAPVSGPDHDPDKVAAESARRSGDVDDVKTDGRATARKGGIRPVVGSASSFSPGSGMPDVTVGEIPWDLVSGKKQAPTASKASQPQSAVGDEKDTARESLQDKKARIIALPKGAVRSQSHASTLSKNRVADRVTDQRKVAEGLRRSRSTQMKTSTAVIARPTLRSSQASSTKTTKSASVTMPKRVPITGLLSDDSTRSPLLEERSTSSGLGRSSKMQSIPTRAKSVGVKTAGVQADVSLAAKPRPSSSTIRRPAPAKSPLKKKTASPLSGTIAATKIGLPQNSSLEKAARKNSVNASADKLLFPQNATAGNQARLLPVLTKKTAREMAASPSKVAAPKQSGINAQQARPRRIQPALPPATANVAAGARHAGMSNPATVRPGQSVSHSRPSNLLLPVLSRETRPKSDAKIVAKSKPVAPLNQEASKVAKSRPLMGPLPADVTANSSVSGSVSMTLPNFSQDKRNAVVATGSELLGGDMGLSSKPPRTSIPFRSVARGSLRSAPSPGSGTLPSRAALPSSPAASSTSVGSRSATKLSATTKSPAAVPSYAAVPIEKLPSEVKQPIRNRGDSGFALPDGKALQIAARTLPAPASSKKSPAASRTPSGTNAIVQSANAKIVSLQRPQPTLGSTPESGQTQSKSTQIDSVAMQMPVAGPAADLPRVGQASSDWAPGMTLPSTTPQVAKERSVPVEGTTVTASTAPAALDHADPDRAVAAVPVVETDVDPASASAVHVDATAIAASRPTSNANLLATSGDAKSIKQPSNPGMFFPGSSPDVSVPLSPRVVDSVPQGIPVVNAQSDGTTADSASAELGGEMKTVGMMLPDIQINSAAQDESEVVKATAITSVAPDGNLVDAQIVESAPRATALNVRPTVSNSSGGSLTTVPSYAAGGSGVTLASAEGRPRIVFQPAVPDWDSQSGSILRPTVRLADGIDVPATPNNLTQIATQVPIDDGRISLETAVEADRTWVPETLGNRVGRFRERRRRPFAAAYQYAMAYFDDQRCRDAGVGTERLKYALFEMDVSQPSNNFRFRFEAGYDWEFPDRAEYFWSKMGSAKGPGLTIPVENSVDYHDYRFAFEVGGERLSVTTEIPLHFIDPTVVGNTGGMGDMQLTTKTVMLDGDSLQITQVLRNVLPTGSSKSGRGMGHVAMEPGLIARYDLTDRTQTHNELKLWFPLGGDPSHSGPVLRYGAGFANLFYDSDTFAVIPTFEFVGWSVLGGLKTGSFGQDIDIDGENIFNVYPGVRFVFDTGNGANLFEFGVNGGAAMTTSHWYSGLFRMDLRWTY